jgi:hypothetical protein
MGFRWRFTSRWRHNFAGSRDVEVTVPGQRRPARAVLVDDAETVVVLNDLADRPNSASSRRNDAGSAQRGAPTHSVGAAGDGQAIWLVDREGRTAPVPSVSITRGAAEFTLPLGNLAEHVAEADGVPLTAQPWERGWGYGTSPGVWVVDRSRVQSQWAWRVTRSASVIWLLLRRRS